MAVVVLMILGADAAIAQDGNGPPDVLSAEYRDEDVPPPEEGATKESASPKSESNDPAEAKAEDPGNTDANDDVNLPTQSEQPANEGGEDPLDLPLVNGPFAAPGVENTAPLEPLACPKDAKCIPDVELVALLLRYRRTLEKETTPDRPRTRMLMERLALTDDVRVVPLLIRASWSSSKPNRHAALGFLSRFVDVPAARDRLLETLRPDGEIDDAEAALPGILAANIAPVPCAPDVKCAPDAKLLAALMAISGATTEDDVVRGLIGLGTLGDPRGLAIVFSHTRSKSPRARRAAYVALNGFDDPRAQSRMKNILVKNQLNEIRPLLENLIQHPRPWFAETLLLMRERKDERIRSLADEALTQVAPDVLVKLQQEEAEERERRQLAERAEDKAARAAEAKRIREQEEQEKQRIIEAQEREEFIRRYGTRTGVAASAGLAGLYGGAFAGAHLGSLFPDSNEATEFFYGGWGSLMGAVSAATLSWFLLSDVELTVEDVGMTTTGSVMGAWAGGWVPALIGGEDVDQRFVGYSAALGHLGGLGVASLAAAYLDPKWSDLAEVNAFVLAANAAAAGAIVAIPFGVDDRVVAGTYIGATVLGVAAAAATTWGHDLDTRDIVHMSAMALGAGGAGMFGGLAAAQFTPTRTFEQTLGGTLLGASAGIMVGFGLSALELTPGYGGALYEVYAAGVGAAAGLGSGLLLGSVLEPIDGVPAGFVPLALAAGGAVGGMATTAIVPDGISLDVGDLLLQPVIVGLALYQTAGLGLAAGADPLITIGSALLAPALVSATLLYTAPLFSPTLGDVAMIGFMTATGAAVSSLMVASAATHLGDAVEPWMWVAATAAGMDLGVLAGIGLNFLDVEQLGWMVSYVAAVSVGTTFMLSFPGALLVPLTDGAIQVPDVMLASGAIGLAVGLGTVWLIDFSIVPKLNLDEHLPLSLPEGLVVQPSFAPLPSRDGREVIPVAGLSGSF